MTEQTLSPIERDFKELFTKKSTVIMFALIVAAFIFIIVFFQMHYAQAEARRQAVDYLRDNYYGIPGNIKQDYMEHYHITLEEIFPPDLTAVK